MKYRLNLIVNEEISPIKKPRVQRQTIFQENLFNILEDFKNLTMEMSDESNYKQSL